MGKRTKQNFLKRRNSNGYIYLTNSLALILEFLYIFHFDNILGIFENTHMGMSLEDKTPQASSLAKVTTLCRDFETHCWLPSS
jgi:hypothetical protein